MEKRMLASHEAVEITGMLAFARRLVGGCTVVADRSWPHRESTVLEVEDGGARRWIVKRCRQAEHFGQELTAYHEWVRSLDGLAPALVAADPAQHTLLLTREPGEITSGRDPALHRQAGRLIRRFHDAAAPCPAPDFAERMRDRLEHGLALGGGIFGRRDADFVRAQVATLAGLPVPVRVPTHQDNQPRNWLVDDRGVVRLIDFGLSKWDVWVRDLLRLHAWDWQHDPGLEAAFLDGYGRSLGTDDRQLLRALGALTALMTVLWAREHGDVDFEQRGWKALEVARADRS
jgi:hypothetical protein